MAVRVGINGLGRIGKGIISAWISRNFEGLEIVAVNDMIEIGAMTHLLKYDSVHGRIKAEVQGEGNSLSVGGRKIQLSSSRDPKEIPWGKNGVDIVLECTGFFTDKSKASAHLRDSVKKVIISAPSKDPDATIVMGVNEKTYQPDKHQILSNASCTTNCLATTAKVLNDEFGIERGFMTTIHSYTNDQQILDKYHPDFRRARAGGLSMIPTTTGAAKSIGVVLPELAGKLDGLAIRVPTPNVSIVDLVASLKKKTTPKEINDAFRRAAAGPMKGILTCSDGPLVSSDFNGTSESAIIDTQLTSIVEGGLAKVLAWYDNETGFSNRMLDLVGFIARSL